MAANRPAAVGGFVLGGLVLALAAILVFGGLHLFTKTARVMVYFDGSVAGLAVGSPVTFRGVQVGTVRDIKVYVNVPDLKPVIPVTLELEPERISWINGPVQNSGEDLRRAVAAGLRAQLSTQSLVTGQLSIDLDFRPDTPAVLLGPANGPAEIPTSPSAMQQIKDQLLELNLPALADKALHLMVSLQDVLDPLGSRIGPAADTVLQTAGAARAMLDAATEAIRALQADAARTLDQVDTLATASRNQVATSGKQLDQVLRTAERTASQAEKLMASLNDIASPRSAQRANLDASLRDLAASASSLRTLTRDLQRSPARTLFGGGSK